MPNIRPFKQFDFSGGVQNATSRLMRKSNEMASAANIRLSERIGTASRRLGYSPVLTLRANKDGLGAFVHRFRTGTRLFGIVNNSGDTQAELFYKNGSSATSLYTSIIPNVRANAANFLDQLFVVGADLSNNFMTPLNIDTTPSVSTSRNMLGMPAAKYIVEFQRRLYAMNVQVGSNKYSDRAYYSSAAQGFMTTVQGPQSGALTSLLVDSVRYPKAGMNIDIYAAGTETKLYDLTIVAVDKNAGRIYFGPGPMTLAYTSVNTTTDTFTTTSTTGYTTGMPVWISSDATLPTPLVASTTYYIIVTSGTTFKLASSPANATAGTAIDITAQGSGNHSIGYYISVSDNDEIWLDGTKGTLTTFWNTDWPVPEDSDWIAVPAGQDEDNSITGYAKSNNRLFIFTKNSITKYDGQNPITLSSTIGCLNHNCIQEIQGWLIFPHYTGIWAYNDSSGDMRLISKGIKNYLDAVPLSNWDKASAISVGNVYKLACGPVTKVGDDIINADLRLVYDFDSNAWTPETHTRNMRYQFNWAETGARVPYFQDDTGKIYMDEQGNLDDTDTIPMEIEVGRNSYNLDEAKEYVAAYFYTARARNALVKYQLDGGEWKDLGQLDQMITKLTFPRNTRGHDINFKIVHDHKGDGMMLEGITTQYSVVESYRG